MARPLDPAQYSEAYTLDRRVGDRAYALVFWLHYFGGRARVSEGLRTAERQRYLYASGRTRPGPILTHVTTSRHQSGRAFDIDFVGYSPNEVPREWWEFAGRIGEALGLKWGGRWPTLRDYRHFEL